MLYRKQKKHNESAYSAYTRKRRPLPDPRAGYVVLLFLALCAVSLAGVLLMEDRLLSVPSAVLAAFGARDDAPSPTYSPRPSPTATAHIEVLLPSDTPAPTPTPASVLPRILIYHTHATEAYRQTDGHEYEASGEYRTEDPENNVTAVGAVLCDALERLGYGVLHDTANHEPPKLSTSYARSLESMLRYKARCPSLSVFIDVHRDAFGSSDSGKTDFVTLDGQECARIMFVVGTGKGATGTGFAEMPDFDKNYLLAERITNYLKSLDPGLIREVRVKTGRYNQHVSAQCLLVEVGHNKNTLTQAKNAALRLAEAIDYVLSHG